MQISKFSKGLVFVASSLPSFVFAGCMSILHYHEIDGVTKTPFSGTKTDLGLATTSISDPEIRGTMPGVAMFAMSAIDAPLSLVADTLLFPRDLRRSLAARQIEDE